MLRLNVDLIRFKYRYDFGHDFYVQILNIKRWSLLQVSVSWNDYPSWPYGQLSFGSNGMLSILFWVFKFGMDIDILSRTWRWESLLQNPYDENETDLG